MGKIEIHVSRNVTGEIGAGDGYGSEFLHVAEDDKRARGIDWCGGDSEVSEVLEAREPDTSESLEGVDASEGVERGREVGGEMNGRDGTVEEGKGVKRREGLESSEGESDIVLGTVRECEREEVAERLGGITE